MGEAQKWLFEPSFNRAVKVCASDDRITSDAGFLLLREADHRLGLTESLAQRLFDPRRQDLIAPGRRAFQRGTTLWLPSRRRSDSRIHVGGRARLGLQFL